MAAFKRQSHKLHAKNIFLFYRVGYAGDNFVRYTGDTISMAQTQCEWFLVFCDLLGFLCWVLFLGWLFLRNRLKGLKLTLLFCKRKVFLRLRFSFKLLQN